MSQAANKLHEPHPLDALTDGAFSASTSGERAARVREWLAKEPSAQQMQEVFKELSVKDKGAAKLLREKLDELKRAKGQEVIAQEWAGKAQALLDAPRLNIADAMAWQRDAAKAGAPLSREPLAQLKAQLAERVKIIEDLQHRVQVQREAAVLLAQRIEVLSTKSWRDAQAAWEALQADVNNWQTQAATLPVDANWASVEAKFPPLLEASRAQLLAVWEAFKTALEQTVAASTDATAPLPPVPVWADELRQLRGLPAEPVAKAPKPPKPSIPPEQRAQATAAVQEVLAKLEQEIAEGHGKASAGAAAALRNALKEHGRLIDDKLEAQVHAALGAAGELEGWQRWRADQLREELVAKAEALLKRPDGQALGGRKMQESLRALREQWKQTDQGGVPNHAAWKRFDEACNEAYKVVQAWLDKVKAEAAEHRGQRLALIEELKAWAADNTVAKDDDWKGFNRVLHQFSDRWRDAGHLSEKAFAEMQPQWKAAMAAASAPLEALQQQSMAVRQAMVEEAAQLGAAPMLRIDAVKSLQQRWQAEAHRVPLERRQEQKLWDAFRKPIDDAFNRKTAEREKANTALSERDRAVLDAAKALEAANQSGNAQAISAAMAGLDAALRGQAQAKAQAQVAAAAVPAAEAMGNPATGDDAATPASPAEGEAAGEAASEATPGDAAQGTSGAAPAAPAPAPKAVPKPVVAVRGDDRPGMRKAEPAPAGRGGRFGDRKDAARGGRDARPGRPDDRGPRGDGGRDAGRGRFGGEERSFDAAPRLGDAAFRAQREALEHAQLALKKLAAQAHGEALTQLLSAWEHRDAAKLPGAQELGGKVSSGTRGAWAQALGQPAQSVKGQADTALLRLEMAAEAPTPAEHLDARRALQLQLLTRRNDPAPGQTWGLDTATVLASDFDGAAARRLQNTLRLLLKK